MFRVETAVWNAAREHVHVMASPETEGGDPVEIARNERIPRVPEAEIVGLSGGPYAVLLGLSVRPLARDGSVIPHRGDGEAVREVRMSVDEISERLSSGDQFLELLLAAGLLAHREIRRAASVIAAGLPSRHAEVEVVDARLLVLA